MIIGIPKEVRDQEYRVSASPNSVEEFIKAGHEVIVQKDAGIGIGRDDASYRRAGAVVVDTAEEVWTNADFIYKVKDPVESEFKYLNEKLTVFAYLHLAANKALVDAFLNSGATGIGFETIEVNGKLPLLKPMSEIGGCMAIQEGAFLLTKAGGGKGKLLQGLPGVEPSHVVIVGGGVAGTGAIRTAVGIGARVSVLDIDVERLAQLADIYGSRLETVYSNEYNVRKAVKSADLLVGAVLVPGGRTPKVVSEEMVKSMEPGSVIIDIAIDQGGCVETIDKPTTHTKPTYLKHGIIHYAVSNIPGTISRSATYALSNVTTRFALEIANKGWRQAAIDNPSIAKGINLAEGKYVHPAVASAFGQEAVDLNSIL
ncbi:alanine dehydrogenase [Microaceticoccus formicicus]|uniref:alanine dehydrogenase n=1 Tax=Microaceticoccus formicicus TaxID=3118105 RepID=UPI003CD01305|nr:alanine dehydrogenase [Peptoniphilaceae bacterium AMB_02]